jgi:hypothetical protein
MRSSIDEACEAVQAAARGKNKATIRRMLWAEFQSREVDLPPPLFDVAVERIAAGTYVRGEPLVSVRRSGVLHMPIIGKVLRHALGPSLEALREHVIAEGAEYGVVWVTKDLTDSWPLIHQTLPHPPGRGLHAPEPDEAPPPARLIPDPDLRQRIPDLFDPPGPKLPPEWSGMPTVDEADLVFAWLNESGGTVDVCCPAGRIGVLNGEDAGPYLPLVRAAHAQDTVVAATTDLRATAGRLLPAIVRVVTYRSGA